MQVWNVTHAGRLGFWPPPLAATWLSHELMSNTIAHPQVTSVCNQHYPSPTNNTRGPDELGLADKVSLVLHLRVLLSLLAVVSELRLEPLHECPPGPQGYLGKKVNDPDPPTPPSHTAGGLRRAPGRSSEVRGPDQPAGRRAEKNLRSVRCGWLHILRGTWVRLKCTHSDNHDVHPATHCKNAHIATICATGKTQDNDDFGNPVCFPL